MKYIRTKDGIFEVTLISPLDFVRIDKRDGTYPDVFEKDILKQADTIEELCDVFIVIDEDKKRNIYLKEDGWTFDMMQDLGMWSDRTCYGAIWTDKGLIYVAKMNDKGELELL